MMSKKLYLAALIFAVLGLLTGTAHLAADILARGFFRVNYGQVLFPALLGVWAFAKVRGAQPAET